MTATESGRQLKNKRVQAGADLTRAERLKRLEAVLRKLALPEPTRNDAIPYAFLIPGIAELLFRASYMAPQSNNYAQASQLATKRQLASLSKCAGQLLVKIDKFNRPAIVTMGMHGNRIRDLRLKLIIIQLLPEVSTIDDVAFVGRKGRPPKSVAAKVTKLAGQEYERLTGRSPTVTVADSSDGYVATGAFIAFLTEIFETLVIDASPEAQARKLRPKGGKTPEFG